MSDLSFLTNTQSYYAFRQATCGTQHFPRQLILNSVNRACWQLKYGERYRLTTWSTLGDNLFSFPIISDTITVDSDSFNRPQIIVDDNCILTYVVYAAPSSAEKIYKFLCNLESPEATESTLSKKRKMY